MNKISKYAASALRSHLKPSVLPLLSFFLLSFFFLTCSLEKPVGPDEIKPIDASIITPSTSSERFQTRGTPIDTVSQMVDYNVSFGFFCSYSNTNMWSAATDAPGKMFNEKMEPYYDLTHPYPDVVLWKYAGTPVQWLQNRSDDHYTFFGYAPFATGLYHATTNPTGNGVTVTTTATTPGIPALSYTVPVKVENQPDLMLAVPVKDLVPTGHPVQMHLNHALTAVGFRVKGANGEKVTNICLTDIYTKGDVSMDGGNIVWSIDPASKQDVDFSASINFDSGQTYRTVPTSFTDDFFIDHSWLMMIPQTLGSTAVIKVTLTDGTTRQLPLDTYTWEEGKRILYDMTITPVGAITVIPSNTLLPYRAQTPASPQHLTVVCLQFDGSPDPTADWELSVPSSAPWLQLALLPDGSDAGSSVVGTGTQSVYLVVTAHLGLNPPRSANLSLDGGVTTAAVVSQNALPGDNFSGWIYVRKGAIGSGMDWGDAVPTIADGISMAQFLINNGYGSSFKGVLVAGGSARVYNESFNINNGMKIYGGWEGVPGTELGPSDDPYLSPYRKLAQYKAVLNVGGAIPNVIGSGTLLDGFIMQGVTAPATWALYVNNNACVNAIEITGQTIILGALRLDNNATASNVLIANNTCAGVWVERGSKLINATIVNNTNNPEVSRIFDASMYNSVVWNSDMTFMGTNTVEYCAFPASNTAGLALHPYNIALHPNNTAWFNSSNLIPGPHFNFNTDITKPYYSAVHDRSPMLGRGEQTRFDSNTPFMSSSAAKTDINGNPRHNEVTDMGCYEDPTYVGFQIRWASDRVYVSSKDGTVNQIPLLLPDNEILQIQVNWSISVVGTLNYCTFDGPSSGVGTGVMVGIVNFTTVGNYTAGGERQCGSIMIHTSLGGYLADSEIEVWQVPGTSSLWENGYVGSFHRNSETSERYITGENSYAVFVEPPGNNTATTLKQYYKYWSARIVSGLDWIKLDTNPKGSYSGVVQETYGGVVSGNTPNDGDAIRFRVGLKSTLPAGAPPRYGLIIISRGNLPDLADGATWFFVRQGEEDDYLYRPTNVPGVTPDPRTAGTGNRNNAKKYPPFNLIAPSSVNGGVDVRPNPLIASTAGFVSHPTKIGDFFQRNQTMAYRRGVQTLTLPTTYDYTTPWQTGQDVCPFGYRHPNYAELYESLYLNVPTVTSTFSGTNAETMRGFLWGYYADGYFDQNAPDPVPAGNAGGTFVGSQPNVAAKGILMVNHANFASLFFPLQGTMTSGSPASVGASYSIYNLYIDDVWVPTLHRVSGATTSGTTGFYPTNFWNPVINSHAYGTTHWVSGHVGLACTPLAAYSATPVRCIKDE